jgi:hypothetical protein
MWPIKPDRDQSRGGFQNSDVGRTQFDGNYGPDYGIDYARFSDPPDTIGYQRLKSRLDSELALFDSFVEREMIIRNGFVILKGKVSSESEREKLIAFVKAVPDVVDVIHSIEVGSPQ